MRFFWSTALKDLRRYRRDATALGLWFLLPFVILGLIGLVFGRGDTVPQGLLLIADEDGGVAGAFLRESINRSSLGNMLAIQGVDRATGRKRIDHGDGSALLIIPKGYDRAVMRDEAARVILITNPEQHLMPQVIRDTASALVGASSYLQQIAGTQLRAFEDVPLSLGSVAVLATGVGRTTGGVAAYLNPPRVHLKTAAIGDPSRRTTVPQMLFPGSVFLMILMMAAGMSMEIWKEARAGAVRRVAGSPSSPHAFLGGKIAATSAVLLVAILLTFAFARLAFQIPMRGCGLAIAWSVCSGMVVYCGLVLAQLWLASERTAMTVAGTIMVPLAMLGGSFFPVETMPESFAKLAGKTPNGWMMFQLQAILGHHVAGSDVVRNFAVLAAAGVLLFVLVKRSLVRRFAG